MSMFKLESIDTSNIFQMIFHIWNSELTDKNRRSRSLMACSMASFVRSLKRATATPLENTESTLLISHENLIWGMILATVWPLLWAKLDTIAGISDPWFASPLPPTPFLPDGESWNSNMFKRGKSFVSINLQNSSSYFPRYLFHCLFTWYAWKVILKS